MAERPFSNSGPTPAASAPASGFNAEQQTHAGPSVSSAPPVAMTAALESPADPWTPAGCFVVRVLGARRSTQAPCVTRPASARSAERVTTGARASVRAAQVARMLAVAPPTRVATRIATAQPALPSVPDKIRPRFLNAAYASDNAWQTAAIWRVGAALLIWRQTRTTFANRRFPREGNIDHVIAGARPELYLRWAGSGLLSAPSSEGSSASRHLRSARVRSCSSSMASSAFATMRPWSVCTM